MVGNLKAQILYVINAHDFTSKFISIANKNPIVKQNLTMITNFSNDTNNKSKVILWNKIIRRS